MKVVLKRQDSESKERLCYRKRERERGGEREKKGERERAIEYVLPRVRSTNALFLQYPCYRSYEVPVSDVGGQASSRKHKKKIFLES